MIRGFPLVHFIFVVLLAGGAARGVTHLNTPTLAVLGRVRGFHLAVTIKVR
jgi:hypothetical protein